MVGTVHFVQIVIGRYFGNILCHNFHFREHKRKTFDSIVNFGLWQTMVLLSVGFLGGIFSAIAGRLWNRFF